MGISGSDGERKIRNKISEVETQHDSFQRELSSCESHVNRLMSTRESFYTQLATFYLPELDADDIQRTLRGVQSQVQSIFEQKQKDRKKLEELMSAAESNRTTFESQLDETTQSLEQKTTQRDTIIELVNEELAQHQEYQTLVKQAEVSGQLIEQNKERLEEFKQDSERKLRQYGNSKLFMYLINRNFAPVPNETYQPSVLTKNLDRWVARKVHFNENKPNYDFLLNMPELMQEELTRRQTDHDDLINKIEAIEKSIEDKHSLAPVVEEGTRLGRQREQLITRIKQKEEEHKRYEQQRRTLDNKKGQYHNVAVQKLKEFLKGETIQELKQKARETTDERDDGLVYRIEEIDSQVRGWKDKSKTAKNKRDSVAEKLNGLKSVLSNYRSSDYESGRSYFDSGFDMDTLLIGYLLGRHSQSQVWSQIDTHQNFKPKPRPVSTYRSSSSSSSSFGSFGGGGFSSGGGFGGGGFSSGGGF